MAEIWRPKAQDVLQGWIDAIVEEASDNLSSWETGFIDSIQTQLLKSGSLSKAQEDTLEHIYTEKTS